MKRAALIAGASAVALLCVGASPSSARIRDVESWGRGTSWSSDSSFRKRKHASRSETKSGKAAEKASPPPSGPLHVIVSIDAQRATLYANGVPVASTPISSGTPGHPTPMGVFTVIQKDRYHVSNLYDAAMPYMQRITWSGSALHQGPLPGYPASHGCVRLTSEFAQLLWRTTKLGARVIVTRPNVAPADFESPRLTPLKPKPVSQPQAAEPTVTAALIRTAHAGNGAPTPPPLRGDAKPLEPVQAGDAQAEQPTKLSAIDGIATDAAEPRETSKPAAPEVKTIEQAPPRSAEATTSVERSTPPAIIIEGTPATAPAAIVREIKQKPISVFISLKERRLYVRQGWEPLFNVPVTIDHPEQPIGTHIYTAMGLKAGGDFRWTVVSIPSGYSRAAESKHSEPRRKGRNEHASRAVDEQPSLLSPSAALDRIVIPPDVTERIAQMMMPGSSLIVSDNKLSDETDQSTDFIVITPASYARN
jgi:hypothetical protein